MRDDFGGLIAASPASLRRDPTAAEVAGGLACGASGKDFWNEILFAESSILSELNTVLDAAGIAPDETQTNQLLAALLKIVPAQSKSLFNVQQLTTQTRVSMSTSGVGAAVIAWSGMSFVKKSSTSDLLVLANFECRTTSTPGNGFGASYVNLNVGSAPQQKIVATNGYPGFASLTNFVRKITGLAAAAQAISLSFERQDTNTWTTVFNPTSADESGRLPTNTAYLLIAEVEPT